MNKAEFLQQTLAGRRIRPQHDTASAFAPVNIALAKYWGKRQVAGNLPTNDSLSITLPEHGTQTTIEPAKFDQVYLNDKLQGDDAVFHQRLFGFLDAIDNSRPPLSIRTTNNIATAAGLASSASGFAALIACLNQLCHWQLSDHEWSILARIGSGSACRSIANGFVRWHRGQRPDGLDSHAQALAHRMTQLGIGLMTLTKQAKPIGSTLGMQQTAQTCPLFSAWPDFANASADRIQQAIENNDLTALMSESEHNAMTMHATMIATRPSVLYWQPESVAVMHQVWQARAEGLAVYFTMDAGPNIKLLFNLADQAQVVERFANIEIIRPFA